jgi:hypothetical protein
LTTGRGDRPSTFGHRKKWILGLSLLLAAGYLLAGSLLLSPYLTNADAVSYVSLAQKYARGEIAAAVNGYWSPLLSWLVAPAIFFGANPVIAAKVVILLAGLVLAAGVYRLGRRFELPPGLRFFLAALSLPIILVRYTMGHITPDLLVATVLVYYLDIVFDPSFFQKKSAWLWAGTLGGLAYLAKHYAFFFIPAHLLALSIYGLWMTPGRSERGKIVLRFCQTLLVFLAVSGAWVTALSLKYHRLTVSTAGRIAFSLQAPGSEGHITKARHLIPPPNASAISAWEDPSLYRYAPSWPSLRSGRQLRNLLGDILGNAGRTVSLLGNFSLWSWLLFPLAVVLALWPRRHRPALLALATILIYTAGYLMVGVESRYLDLDEMLILLLGGYALALTFRRLPAGRTGLKVGLALTLAVPFVLTPDSLSPGFRRAHPQLWEGRKAAPGRDVYAVSRPVLDALGERRPPTPDGRRAALASDCCYQRNLILAWYGDLAYYGILGPGASPGRLEEEIRENGVDYFLLWTRDKKAYPFLRGRSEIRHAGPRRPLVFDLRPTVGQSAAGAPSTPTENRSGKTGEPPGDAPGGSKSETGGRR